MLELAGKPLPGGQKKVSPAVDTREKPGVVFYLGAPTKYTTLAPPHKRPVNDQGLILIAGENRYGIAGDNQASELAAAGEDDVLCKDDKALIHRIEMGVS